MPFLDNKSVGGNVQTERWSNQELDCALKGLFVMLCIILS